MSRTTMVVHAALLALITVPVVKDGKPVTKKGRDGEEPVLRPLQADEVYAARDHGDRVVVVTTDGQKYAAAVPAHVRKKVDDEAAAASTPPAS